MTPLRRLLTRIAVPLSPLLGVWLSTEFFAWRVGFHPKLGAPWLMYPVPLYAPWNWFGWAVAAAPSSPELVLLTSLPLMATLLVTTWFYIYRSPARPSVTAPSSPLVSDSTMALTLSDDDVEALPRVTPPLAPHTQELTLSDLEEVPIATPPPSPSSIMRPPPDGRDSSPSGRTAQADAPSYQVLQALSRQGDEAPSSARRTHAVGSLDETLEHDAPTAEAPTPDFPRGSTLQVDPPQADWAHEVETAEAPARRLDDPPASPTAEAPLPLGAMDSDVRDELSRTLDPAAYEQTAEDSPIASGATMRLNPGESEQLARLLSSELTHTDGPETAEAPIPGAATVEGPAPPDPLRAASVSGDRTIRADTPDTPANDDSSEDWLL